MNVSLLLVAAAAVGLGGCESFSDAVRERIAARDEPQIRTFAATPGSTYDAVRAAAADMGYRFVRGGPAQGEFEAISGVRSGETLRTARQISMTVSMRPTLDGTGTETSVRLKEIIESDSSNRAGQATVSPLRHTPQYDVFFTRVGRELGVPAAEPEFR